MHFTPSDDQRFSFRAIGLIHTPFREKFGIPRQSGLVEEAEGRIELLPPFDRPEAFKDIDGFSHLWLIWVAHRANGDSDSLTVRPPRLGGNRKVGVFASRSPFRPNPIGLSLVRLVEVDMQARPPALRVTGVDLLDGTPILDIKPYLPYSDAVPDAEAGYAATAPDRVFEVRFSEEANLALAKHPDGDRLRKLVERMLELDPRPAYRDESTADYAFRVDDLDVHWRVRNGLLEVMSADQIDES